VNGVPTIEVNDCKIAKMDRNHSTVPVAPMKSTYIVDDDDDEDSDETLSDAGLHTNTIEGTS
jgi:hypothetical protein